MSTDRRDFAAPANRLIVTEENGQYYFNLGENEFTVNNHALNQLGDRLGKGVTSFGKEMDSKKHHDLRANILNELCQREQNKKFQVRAIQEHGQLMARAVTSDSFLNIDDNLLVPTICEIVGSQPNWRSLGGQITDTNTFIKFISRTPVALVGPHKRPWYLGFMYGNSEVGCSTTNYKLFIHDGFCENGCIFGLKSIIDVAYRHIGSKIQSDFGLISEERIQRHKLLEIQGAIHDATKTVLASDFSDKIRNVVEGNQQRKLDTVNAHEEIKEITKFAGLGKDDYEKVLGHWDSKENDLLGVSHAITRLAQDQKTYDQRVKLEQAGGKLLEMTDRQWKSLQALAS